MLIHKGGLGMKPIIYCWGHCSSHVYEVTRISSAIFKRPKSHAWRRRSACDARLCAALLFYRKPGAEMILLFRTVVRHVMLPILSLAAFGAVDLKAAPPS